jgi:hypothetical protein
VENQHLDHSDQAAKRNRKLSRTLIYGGAGFIALSFISGVSHGVSKVTGGSDLFDFMNTIGWLSIIAELALIAGLAMRPLRGSGRAMVLGGGLWTSLGLRFGVPDYFYSSAAWIENPAYMLGSAIPLLIGILVVIVGLTFRKNEVYSVNSKQSARRFHWDWHK